ncbi:MAG: histone deacetylase [Spirochaetota bacterium]|nr:histone deacetylase [Spirochaetota bacterium]
MGKTAYLYNKIYTEHDTKQGHPERSERLLAIDEKLKSSPFYKDLIQVDIIPADVKHIELIHERKYIERVKKEIESGILYLDSMDTVVSDRSYEVSLYAVGGCLNMCDYIMRGEAENGFCAVRPPGHHAENDYAAGFCIFNNIAIAAKYLQSAHNIKKIAILDWDVHHGNGTQHSFESDNSIYYISLHQYPHYPGTGTSNERGFGDGEGYTLNIPMRAGSGDKEYLEAFNKQILPELENFKPEIILISAGFDAHISDPLSSIYLSTDMYYQFTKMLKEIANKYSNKRVISFLEGGYNLDALEDSVYLMMKAFVEDD